MSIFAEKPRLVIVNPAMKSITTVFLSIKSVLGFFLMLFTGTHVFAQSQDSVQNLTPFTISAPSRPRISSNIGQLQSINASTLQRLNAIQLSDAVKYFAGTTVKDYGGIGGLKTVSVRGFSASHTGIFIDHIPTSNAMNGQIDLGKYSLDNVNEIRLSNDNFSSDLQTASYYAKASQLGIFTTTPGFDLDKKTRAELALKVGSFGLFNPKLNIEQRIWKNQALSLNADLQKSKGDYTFKLVNGQTTTTETRSNSEVETYRVDLKWQNWGASRHRYFVKANYYQSNRQLPGAVILYNRSSNQDLRDEEKSLQGQYSYRFRDSTKILFNAKTSELFSHYINRNYLGSQPLDNQFWQRENFLSGAVQSRVFSGFQASLSSDLFYHKTTSNLQRYAYPTRLTSLTNLVLNYTFRSLFFYGNLSNVSTFEKAKSTAVAKNLNRLSPTLGVHYRQSSLSPFSARFFYKETYRIPTFNELYYTNIGNTNLVPELAQQWNAGFTLENSKNANDYAVISIDGYFNTISDKIVAIPTNNLFTWSMKNIGEVRGFGLDAVFKGGVECRKNLNLFGEINYTFQDARDVSDKTTASFDKQIPYTPKHSGSVILGVETWLTAQYNLLFSGERYTSGANSESSRLEPYFDHGISLSKRFYIKKINLRMSFEILNFTNKNYEIVAYYPMPGRYYRLGVAVEI